MKAKPALPSLSLSTLFGAWLGLLGLTALGLVLARWSAGASGLPLAVAAVVWFKGWLVARHFIESNLAHPFIAWVLRIFIVCVPAALLITTWFGPQLARWTSL
ncbi:MAG: hypothetical protein JNM61_07105 [Zoogloeaceae bacterium]|nr:hypothetical protein [Zoogloeaceae bacterium]